MDSNELKKMVLQLVSVENDYAVDRVTVQDVVQGIDEMQKDLETIYIDFQIATISMLLAGVEPTQALRDKAEEVIALTGQQQLKERIQLIRVMRAEAAAWRAYEAEQDTVSK